MTMIFRIYLILFIAIIASSAHAEVLLSEVQESRSLVGHVEFAAVKIESDQNEEQNVSRETFESLNWNNPKIQVSTRSPDKYQYYKTTVKNDTNQPRNIFFNMPLPMIYSAQSWFFKNNEMVKEFRWGTKAKDINWWFVTYSPNINIAPGETITIVTKFHTIHAISNDMTLSYAEYFGQRLMFRGFLIFFYIGVVFSLLGITLISFIKYREKSTKYYLCYMISMFVAMMASYYFDLIYLNNFSGNSIYLQVAAMACSAAFSLLFCIEFLKIENNKIKKAAKVLNVFLVFSVFYIYATGHVTFVLGSLKLLMFGMIPFFMIMAYRKYKEGQSSALLYGLGWGVFCLAIFIWNIKEMGLLPKGDNFTSNLPILGQSVELIVLSLAVRLRKRESEFALHQQRENSLLAHLIRSVSHDLATPLMVINYSVMRLSKIQDTEIEKALDRCKLALTNIEDLTHSVRNIQLKRETNSTSDVFNLSTALEESIDLFQERFEAKGLSLSVTIDPDLYIEGSAITFKTQVIGNLISNAIKFSDQGANIRIVLFSSATNISLIVQDFGVGMPQEMAERIFDESVKHSRLGTSGESGTGFGLQIINALIQQLGGRIEVQSIEQAPEVESSGTTFKIHLNRVYPTANQLEKIAA
jgi:signal transduction histidine kinase